eukprot:4013186-Karenia_brevis.AAC.1
MAGKNCRANVLATSLRKAEPVAIPRTPPSFFRRAVMLANMKASAMHRGSDALANSWAASCR